MLSNLNLENLTHFVYSGVTIQDISLLYIFSYVIFKVIQQFFYVDDRDQPTKLRINRTLLFLAVMIQLGYYLSIVSNYTAISLGKSITNDFQTALSLISVTVLLLIFYLFISKRFISKYEKKIAVKRIYLTDKDGSSYVTYKHIPTDFLLHLLSFLALSLFIMFQDIITLFPLIIILILFFNENVIRIYSKK